MQRRKNIGDQLTAVAAGFYDFTVRSKNFICAYLLVFYCVIVDENYKVTHQRWQLNEKNGNKVLFYLNTKYLNFDRKKKVSNNRKKNVQRRKQQKGGKGRTVLIDTVSCSEETKRYILIKRKGKKLNLDFKRYKKCLNALKALKIFNYFFVYFNV